MQSLECVLWSLYVGESTMRYPLSTILSSPRARLPSTLSSVPPVLLMRIAWLALHTCLRTFQKQTCLFRCWLMISRLCCCYKVLVPNERSICHRKAMSRMHSKLVALLDDFWPSPPILRYFARFEHFDIIFSRVSCNNSVYFQLFKVTERNKPIPSNELRIVLPCKRMIPEKVTSIELHPFSFFTVRIARLV
jgi:hypothetical protein